MTTPPAILPVSVDLARKHARVFQHYDDDIIYLNLATATSLVQNYLNRTLITTSWLFSFADTYPPNDWPLVPVNPGIFVLPLALEWSFEHLMQRDIELPRSPVQTVQSVSWTPWPNDCNDGNTQVNTLTFATDYSINTNMDPGLVRIYTGQSFTNRACLNINFTSGYSSNPWTGNVSQGGQQIPVEIIQAILITTTAMYENREGGMSALPPAAKDLCRNYRMTTFWS
jgi:hypothetical protein